LSCLVLSYLVLSCLVLSCVLCVYVCVFVFVVQGYRYMHAYSGWRWTYICMLMGVMYCIESIRSVCYN